MLDNWALVFLVLVELKREFYPFAETMFLKINPKFSIQVATDTLSINSLHTMKQWVWRQKTATALEVLLKKSHGVKWNELTSTKIVFLMQWDPWKLYPSRFDIFLMVVLQIIKYLSI